MARRSKEKFARVQPAPAGKGRWLGGYGAELGICLLLVVATAAVFGRTVGYDFVSFDDREYVYENPHVKEGLTPVGIEWAFTGVHALNWHPLTTLSHELDCSLYHLWAGGHHLTNVFLHAAASVVLFLALRQLTGAVWRSGIVAALFCLHPLHVESVAWVAERKDVLSGLFFGLTLWAYAGYAQRPFSWVRYLGVVALFALGLLCKPMLVTLPLVLLLLDYWPLRRGAENGERGAERREGRGEKGEGRGEKGEGRRGKEEGRRGKEEESPRSQANGGNLKSQISDLKSQISDSPLTDPQLANNRPNRAHSPFRLLFEKLPLLALAAASCVATYRVQAAAGAVVDVVTPMIRVQTAVTAYARYLGMMLWPVRLAANYPRDRAPNLPGMVLCGLVLTGISLAVLYWNRRGRRYALVGWLWYLGMLVPVSGLVAIGDQALADRYTYLPLIGIIIAVVWGAADLILTRRASEEASRPRLRFGLLWAVAAVVLALCALRSVDQCGYWRSSEILYRRALAVTPENAMAHANLGVILMGQKGRGDEAADEFREALRINPGDYVAHNNLGFLEREKGNLPAAIEHYRAALEIKPDFALAHRNLADAYARLRRKQEAAMH